MILKPVRNLSRRNYAHSGRKDEDKIKTHFSKEFGFWFGENCVADILQSGINSPRQDLK